MFTRVLNPSLVSWFVHQKSGGRREGVDYKESQITKVKISIPVSCKSRVNVYSCTL